MRLPGDFTRYTGWADEEYREAKAFDEQLAVDAQRPRGLRAIAASFADFREDCRRDDHLRFRLERDLERTLDASPAPAARDDQWRVWENLQDRRLQSLAMLADETKFDFVKFLETLRVDLVLGPQALGDCVGYSAALCLLCRFGFEVAGEGQFELAIQPYVPWLYGAGRVYVGGNRLRGDGSLGTWQIEAARTYGVLPNNLADLPNYGSSTGRAWGSNRRILDAWKAKAAPFRVVESTRITSWNQLAEAMIQHKRPATIASNQGFRTPFPDERVGKTFGKPGGNWAHQMHVQAIDLDDRRPAARVGNQWGRNAHGRQLDGPDGTFWVDADFMDRWLRSATCFAYGETRYVKDPTEWEVYRAS